MVHAAPQDDGRYIPDDEGRYIPDNSGAYYPDNSGAYTEDPRIYDQASYSSSGGYRSAAYRGSASNAGNVYASASGQNVQASSAPGPFAGSGVVSSAPAVPAAPVVAYNAAPQYATPQAYNNNRFYRILKQDQQISEDGYYYL